MSVSAAAKTADLSEEKQHEEVSKASEDVKKKSKDKKKRAVPFKSTGATDAAKGLAFLSKHSNEIKPAAFVKDCPSQRRKEVEEQIAVVVPWCKQVADQLKALPPVSDEAMRVISKLGRQERNALAKEMEREAS